MEKPILSPDFTIDDIHKLREYNHEKTKDMSSKERQNYYNDAGMEIYNILQFMKLKKAQ